VLLIPLQRFIGGAGRFTGSRGAIFAITRQFLRIATSAKERGAGSVAGQTPVAPRSDIGNRSAAQRKTEIEPTLDAPADMAAYRLAAIALAATV
jgi:hypothetical protein